MEVIRLTSYVRRVISIFDPIRLALGIGAMRTDFVREKSFATKPSCSKMVRDLPQVVANPPTGIGTRKSLVQREPAWGAFDL